MSIEKIYRLEITQPDGSVVIEEAGGVQSLQETLQKYRGDTLIISSGLENSSGKRIWGVSKQTTLRK